MLDSGASTAENPWRLLVEIDETRRELWPAPELNRGFAENHAARFIAPGHDQLTLLIDDAPLPAVDEVAGRHWIWIPGFYAGEVRAELLDATGRTVAVWRLEVSPHPAKMGGELFAQMVDEILLFDPSLLLGQEPAHLPMGDLGPSQNVFIELARLRLMESAMTDSFGSIIRRPLRGLRPRRELVPLHRVRRADHRTQLGAARSVLLAAAFCGVETADVYERLANDFADVPSVEHHRDTAANRTLRFMLEALLRRCHSIRDRLQQIVAKEIPSNTTTGIAERMPRWMAIVGRTERQLLRFRSASPFSESRAEISAAGLTAIAAHAAYARAWNCAWRALRSGIEGDQSELVRLCPTWEVYERWCYLRVLQAVQSVLPSVTWTRYDDVNATLGRQARDAAGRMVEVLLQPRFPSTNGNTKIVPWSVSLLRIPDIVVVAHDTDKERFTVFDAKYRSSRESILEAMTSAHVYQDSLRWGERRPTQSLLIVPSAEHVDWLAKSEFSREHRVGVIALRPGAGEVRLAAELGLSCV